MTKKQYLEMKQAARHEVENDGIGFCRRNNYVLIYTARHGYEVYNANRSKHDNFYTYVRACRQLAQLQPGTSAEQLKEYKNFLEKYKK